MHQVHQQVEGYQQVKGHFETSDWALLKASMDLQPHQLVPRLVAKLDLKDNCGVDGAAAEGLI